MSTSDARHLLAPHLWDLRAQIEAQLRRIVGAQRLCDMSRDGADITALIAALDDIIATNGTVRNSCTEALCIRPSPTEPA